MSHPPRIKESNFQFLLPAPAPIFLRPPLLRRGFGVLVGWETGHPFLRRPSYRAIADLPLERRIVELRKPEVRAAILAEEDGETDGSLIEGLSGLASAGAGACA